MSIHCTTATGNRVVIPTIPGHSLAQSIWLTGKISPPALCSGLGRCGRCRVRFLSPAPAPLDKENEILGAEAVRDGWRLACCHAADALPDCHVAIPATPEHFAQSLASTEYLDSGSEPLLLAVDLGTTSLHWKALTLAGDCVAKGQENNPQMGAGADVMSRLAMATTPAGRALLSWLVRRRLASIIAALPAPVREICLAANTAMTDIFLDTDIRGLCAAPYHLSHTGHATFINLCSTSHHDASLIEDLPPTYIPPLPAPFVGGDMSAGMLAIQEDYHPRFPFLLADMGTNGEFALALSEDTTLLTSVPLGPSMEGIGLSLGDLAGPESAVAFRLSPAGLCAMTPSGRPARRIAATGYLSLLRALLTMGLLDREGHFMHTPTSPLAHHLMAGLDSTRNVLQLSSHLFLSARDVEELLKVKAAFSLAMEQLLATAGLHGSELSAFLLAGALGEHVDPIDLETLGFLLPGQSARLHAVGNTALRGAALLLLQPSLRDKLARWSTSCTTLTLTDHATFTHDYLRHMHF